MRVEEWPKVPPTKPLGPYQPRRRSQNTDTRWIQDIEKFVWVRLGPGTLYGFLVKLEAGGLVEALPVEDRRHPYRITQTGLAVLEERLSESARIARLGLRRIAGASE